MLVAVVAAVWRGWAVGSVTKRTCCGVDVGCVRSVTQRELPRVLVVYDDCRSVTPEDSVSVGLLIVVIYDASIDVEGWQ